MILGSEYLAAVQLQQMATQLRLWQEKLDTNIHLVRSLRSEDRRELGYLLGVLKDNVDFFQCRIVR